MYSITVFKGFDFENKLEQFLSILENFSLISCTHDGEDYSVVFLQIQFRDEAELEKNIQQLDRPHRFRIQSRISRYQMLVRFRVYGPIYGIDNFFRGAIIVQRFEKAKTGIYIEFLTPKTGVIYFRDILANEGYSITSQGNIQPTQSPVLDVDKDLEILNVALQMGHFDFPKSCSVKELSDSVGLSTTAVRKRMNRALRNVLSKTFDQEIKDLFS